MAGARPFRYDRRMSEVDARTLRALQLSIATHFAEGRGISLEAALAEVECNTKLRREKLKRAAAGLDSAPRRYHPAREACASLVPSAIVPGPGVEFASTRICPALPRMREELLQKFPNERHSH